MGEKNSRLSYEDFLAAFEEGRRDSYDSAPKDHPYPQVENEALSADASEEKMKKKIAANIDVLHKVSNWSQYYGNIWGHI